MSKAFEQWWEEFTSAHDEWRFADSDALRKAAWNAALDRAIEIVEEQEGCITDSSALLIRREKTE